MGNKPQLIYRTEEGDKDLLYWMERIEKRLGIVEDYIARQIQEEWNDDFSEQTKNEEEE